jgi:hypothetical protein
MLEQPARAPICKEHATLNPQRKPWELLLWLLTGAGVAAGCAFLLFFPPGLSAYGPICGFYRLTGLYCPGCGSSRALYQLLHGNLAAAVQCNPFFVILSPWLLWQYVAWGLRLLSVKSLPTLRPRSAWPLYALAAALSVFGVLRNLPFWPFSLLAPGGP